MYEDAALVLGGWRASPFGPAAYALPRQGDALRLEHSLYETYDLTNATTIRGLRGGPASSMLLPVARTSAAPVPGRRPPCIQPCGPPLIRGSLVDSIPDAWTEEGRRRDGDGPTGTVVRFLSGRACPRAGHIPRAHAHARGWT